MLTPREAYEAARSRIRQNLGALADAPKFWRIRLRMIVAVVAALHLVWFAAPLMAEDAVVLRSESGAGEFRVPGEIIDYTGRAIRIRSDQGLERSYAADRVVRIETEWTLEHVAGDEAQAAGQFAAAIEQYRRAVQTEPRTWVRRKILAELVWCYRAAGRQEAAGDAFLLLLSSDPATPYFDSIPLAWLPTEAVSPQRATAWLERDDLPAAQLLGASYLMSGAQRGAALAALDQLAQHDDPRIAALAIAQRWRAEAFQATAAETAAWMQVIEQMPEPLRGGAYFVLGQTLARQRRHDEAALALLRVPILFDRDRELAAAALVLAGQSLEQASQPDEARRLYQEAIDAYGDSRWRSEARARLEQLAPQGNSAKEQVDH